MTTNDRLTKSRLVDEVAAKTGLTKVAVEKTITEVQNSIIEAVSDGKRVTLSNFVSFTPSIRKPRKMLNPKTKKLMDVREKQIVKVSVLEHFEEKVSGDR